jgi:hypothetical protein
MMMPQAFLLVLALAAAPVPSLEDGDRAAALDNAIRRGVEYLIAVQNKNGSFGTHRTGRPTGILAAVPGSHQAFQVATSALCLMALDMIPPNDRSAAHEKAVKQGLEYMIDNALVKRPNSAELYNVWAFGYGLECLGRMLPKISDPDIKARARKTAESLVEVLELYQVPDGGWGYFDFDYGAYRPAGSSMSFTTATVVVGLYEAKKAGLAIPEKMLNRALKTLRRARKADGSYIYGDYLKYMPNMPVNKVKGSISRTPACHIAQYYFGGKITRDDFAKSLEDLLKHQHFADIGRKRPIPHEAWYQTSGYFFLYGQYYVALVMRELPPEDQKHFIPAYEDILFKLQEPDGSWWDYPLYSYHKPYGTGYAVMSLCIYRELQKELN